MTRKRRMSGFPQQRSDPICIRWLFSLFQIIRTLKYLQGLSSFSTLLFLSIAHRMRPTGIRAILILNTPGNKEADFYSQLAPANTLHMEQTAHLQTALLQPIGAGPDTNRSAGLHSFFVVTATGATDT